MRALMSSPVRIVLAAVAAGALVTSAFVAAPAVATPSAVVKADDTKLTFTVALNYDRAGLLASARAISTPGGPAYRNFLTVKEVAAEFGASAQDRASLRKAATKLGMTVRFSATGMTAQLTAPATTWTRLYGMEPALETDDPWVIVRYIDPKTGAFLPTPAALGKHVRLVFPTTSIIPPATKSSPSKASPRASADDDALYNQGTPFGPGLDCLNPAIVDGDKVFAYSPNQINTAYGTGALHDRGLRGSGVRIANLASGYAPTQAYSDYAANCFGYRAPTIRFTGGPGIPGPVTVDSEDAELEANLDVQVIAGVVPAAERIDYVEVGPGLVYLSFLQAIDVVATKVTPMPDVVTTSFGECEPELLPYASHRQVTDDHFALLAVLGVTALAASGDGGSSECSQFTADPPVEQRIQAVGYPASSPWVTGVGGTRLVLGKGNARVGEFAWNDTPIDDSMGAGTGGPSLYAQPWYQRPLTSEDRRLVPDVAAHASAYPGWAAALGSSGTSVLGATGTSAASPFVAANLALIAAAERKAGRGPLGFINPLLYSLASNSTVYRRAFYDVTEGNNQRFIEAACCDATKGYDQATGLGALTFDELIKVIPKPGRGRG